MCDCQEEWFEQVVLVWVMWACGALFNNTSKQASMLEPNAHNIVDASIFYTLIQHSLFVEVLIFMPIVLSV